jgi:uncharacterized protein (DUF488 family)
MQSVKIPADQSAVYTVGHSNHSAEAFVALLRNTLINAVADVRSSPYSRYLPQFNQNELKCVLDLSEISYVFLGAELGGRPREREMYNNGIADYERMASSPSFHAGLRRIVEGAKRYNIALMCSEHDPLDCHRCLLVGRWLAADGVCVRHILANGSLLSHEAIEEQLLDLANKSAADLFASHEERLAIAYRERSRKVAYAESMSEQNA